MVAVHTEEAFEAAIETHLLANGYLRGDKRDFDMVLALDPVQVLAFIRDSQPREWGKLVAVHGPDVEIKVLTRLAKELDGRGMLDVLRHGITDYGVSLKLAYFKPAHTMAPELGELYGRNRLSVARQVRYSAKHANELDLVLFINGLPVATAELKNPLTGQTAQDAIAQYRRDRDPKDLLLSFKCRALVHFAVDPDEVYMTTRLTGEDTAFLPFNLGRGTGAGNPDNPSGYRTAYLWERVWARESWLDIIGRFVHLEASERVEAGKRIRSERILFPRYHQLDAVRKVEAHARAFGPGHNYLIQHSAGSGKSNTIAWLAHRLASLHDAGDRVVFDSVIVVTDRRVLDKQLQDTIYQFEHKHGVVEKIDKHSEQLATALQGGVRIIITTIQKFPYVIEKTGELKGRRFAVVIDEAHSSQTGEAAESLRKALLPKGDATAAKGQAPYDAGPDELLELVAASLQARGRQPHLSYFAFTATPKYKTLTLFGSPASDGKPQPFHLYSMRQAIEERFILDVLKHYITYKTYYRLERGGQGDPELDPAEASKAIARFVSLHPHNIAQRIAVIVEHFRQHTRRKIGGRAKAMVVTASRLHAVRYKQAFDTYIKEKGYADTRALVAFSGKVIDPADASEYTEPGMNGFSERQLPERFKGDDYQVLLVAEKYQTGFDEPLLHTMYVVKRLDGVQAVQTLSRLNRICPGKEDTFVLDFVNDSEDIRSAFQPYYEATEVDEPAEPNRLYDLKSQLDAAQVYWQAEIEDYCRAYFTLLGRKPSASQAALHAAIDPAVTRYKALGSDEAREEFTGRLVAFVRLYAFLSQVLTFQDAGLEMLYAYGRFLLLKLPHAETGAADLGVDVRLEYYRLSGAAEQALMLGEEKIGLKGPSDTGTGGEDAALQLLSTIIGKLNERFGTEFTFADKLVFDQIEEVLVANDGLAQQARANTLDNYQYGFDSAFMDAIVDRKSSNESIFMRILDDPRFAEAVKAFLMDKVYQRQQATATVSGAAGG